MHRFLPLMLLLGCAKDRILPTALAEGRRDDADAYYIVDVRSEREYLGNKGHIADAVHLPWPSAVREQADTLAPEPDQTVVLVCFTGHRSRWAMDRIRSAVDNEVVDLKGGMIRWWRRDLPVVVEARP